MVSGRHSQHGVVRFIATSETSCLVDGTVDGLHPEHRHVILIHEYGDLSSDCDRYYAVSIITKLDLCTCMQLCMVLMLWAFFLTFLV